MMLSCLLRVNEYTSIGELNRLCELVMELEGSPIYDELKEIQGMWFSSLEDLLEHQEDIICYSDCDSMEDVARYFVEETGQLGEIPNKLQNYIDYQALVGIWKWRGAFL